MIVLHKSALQKWLRLQYRPPHMTRSYKPFPSQIPPGAVLPRSRSPSGSSCHPLMRYTNCPPSFLPHLAVKETDMKISILLIIAAASLLVGCDGSKSNSGSSGQSGSSSSSQGNSGSGNSSLRGSGTNLSSGSANTGASPSEGKTPTQGSGR